MLPKGGQDKKSFEAEKKAAAALERSRAEKTESKSQAKATGAENAAAKEKAPVFRHGKDAERICDLALSVTGPSDPRLSTMIKSDAQAQMAFHMQKALEMAVDAYKKSRQMPWGQQGVANPGFGYYDSTPKRQQQAWSPGAQPGEHQQAHHQIYRMQQQGAMMGGGSLMSPWNSGDAPVVQLRSWTPASGNTASHMRDLGGGGGWGGGKKRQFQTNGAGEGPKNKKMRNQQGGHIF